MKVAVFCVPGCKVAVDTIEYFKEKGLNISLVVVETAMRQKFSAAELEFRDAHAKFKELLLKPTANGQNGNRSIAKTFWLSIPPDVRSGVKRFLPASVTQDILTKAANTLGIPIEKVEKHSSQQTRDILERCGISYVLLASSNWLIKEPILSMPNTKVINAHCAKLPQHRSLDALPWSVLENDNVGLTTHFVDAGIDTGPILRFLEVTPQAGDNLISLRERVNSKTAELFWESIKGLSERTITPTPQQATEGVNHRPMTVDQLLEAERVLQERIKSTSTSG